MGMLSFMVDAGKKLLGLGDDNENIKKEIEGSLKETPINDLNVSVNGDSIRISGDAPQDVKEKAALIAGNIAGIKSVEFEGVEEEKDNFYIIQKGDNLSKIAKHFYGDANKYNEIFKANKEVIKDPDLIYPGQKIRIPKLG